MNFSVPTSSHANFCLLYISRVAPEVTPADVDLLVAKSIARNALEGITGFLVRAGDHFVQYLEGPRQAVVDCFARMEKDNRHTEVNLVACHRLPQRRFASWDMGYFQGDDDGVEHLDAVFRTWGESDAALIDEAMRIYKAACQAAADDFPKESSLEQDVLLRRAAS